MKRLPDVMWDGSIPESRHTHAGIPREQREAKKCAGDFIVEGRDQISGWFFSLLKAASRFR